MIRRRCFAVFFIITVVDASLFLIRNAWASRRLETDSLQPMLEVLEKSGHSGSLIFSADCKAPIPPELPQFRVPASMVGSPLSVLREILADSKSIHVRQGADGLIRMGEGGVPDDILNIRIRHISFEGVYSLGNYGVDNPNEAVHIIMQSPEVQSFTSTHHILVLFDDEGVAIGMFSPQGSVQKGPHLSGSFDNVTVQQALDRVLKIFPGIWVYQNCPRSEHHYRKVYFQFFYLRDFGTGKYVEG